MNMTNEEYNEYIKKKQPRSPLGMDMLRAFLVGGLICAGGEGLRALFISLGLDTESAGTAVSISLVFLGALLTGLGLYDDIARFAGAGTLVPITGFANAVVSPAIEFKARSSLYNWDSQRKPQSVSIRTESDKICWEGGT